MSMPLWFTTVKHCLCEYLLWFTIVNTMSMSMVYHSIYYGLLQSTVNTTFYNGLLQWIPHISMVYYGKILHFTMVYSIISYGLL